MVCNPSDGNMSSDGALTLVQSLAISAKALPEGFVNEVQCGDLPIVPHLSDEQIKKQQRADPCLREVIAQLETGEKLPPTF